MELTQLALHVQEMRGLQRAYFASRKEGRYGDKKILAASKAKEVELDRICDEILQKEFPDGRG